MHALARLIITLSLAAATVGCQAQAQREYTSYDSAGHYGDEFTHAELHQLLAPIALYPDTVLSHVLIASTYPLEVVQASRWASANSHLSAEQALDAASRKQWDPSVQALAAFPELLTRMSDDLAWTQQLGDAFLLNEAEVMAAIQELRDKAYAAGSLQQMKHVTVQREEKIIIIEPAIERVVYIPYYDTRVVYGNWWWPQHPPTYWRHPLNHVYIGGFYWGPRAHLGTSFFFTSFHWQQHRVVHIDRRHHHPRRYTSRHIARFDGARPWRHNPVHRRGVDYRHQNLRQHYGQRHTAGRELQSQQRQLERRRFVKPRTDGTLSPSSRAHDLRKQLREGRADSLPARRAPDANAPVSRRFSSSAEQRREPQNRNSRTDVTAPVIQRRAEVQQRRGEVQSRPLQKLEPKQRNAEPSFSRSREATPTPRREVRRQEAAPRREALRERATRPVERRFEANRAQAPRPAPSRGNESRERRTWTRPGRE